MNESELPQKLQESLAVLRAERDPSARLDAVEGNFAYVFVHALRKPVVEKEPDEHLGGWIRFPVSFPDNGPWGLVTIAALPGKNGGINGDNHHPGHDNAKPVRDRGGDHYYSWTWSESPPVRSPADILGVVRWFERRIRLGMS